jgi:hypothetical protein
VPNDSAGAAAQALENVTIPNDERSKPVPEFGEAAGEFVRNLIQLLQQEAERLPSPTAMMESLKEFDLKEFEPTPEQITDVAGKCADAVTAFGKVLAGMVQGARESGKETDPMPDHIEIPDDLRDLE